MDTRLREAAARVLEVGHIRPFADAARDDLAAAIAEYDLTAQPEPDRCPECDHPQDEHRTPGSECVHKYCSCDQSWTALQRLRGAIETEWYNGNIDSDARERLAE